jgi:hypothetical protein
MPVKPLPLRAACRAHPTDTRRCAARRAPLPRGAGLGRWIAPALVLGTCLLAACEMLGIDPGAAKAAAPLAAPAAATLPTSPAPPLATEPKPDLASTADQVARRLLAYHERLLQFTPAELTADITRLDAEVEHTSEAAAPDVVLDLALALAQQRGPGDLARASGLLEAITQAQSADMRPWQPLARLLAGAIDEQRHLEDQLEQQATQRRDTQRAIQQLTEKLEALKAIERSMTTRSTSAPKMLAPAGSGEAPPPGSRQP